MPVSESARAAFDQGWNCHLTTRGRKTGRPRTVTIWYAPAFDQGDEGVVYLTGGADDPQWCRNIRACADVEIEVAGETLVGRAEVIDDEAQATEIRDRFTQRYALARLSRVFGGYTKSVAVRVVLD